VNSVLVLKVFCIPPHSLVLQNRNILNHVCTHACNWKPSRIQGPFWSTTTSLHRPWNLSKQRYVFELWNFLGVNVMITIYFDFRQFSSKKFAFFLKSRCYHPILQKLALFWTKNADFSTKVFGENIFKMMTSVTDLCTYVFHRDVSGTDVIILKYFRRKFWQKIGVFDLNKARLCKILIITLVFGKNANFFAENCQKSKKIVIITSTPDIKCTISTNGCINF
jgi:hypothetical protein